MPGQRSILTEKQAEFVAEYLRNGRNAAGAYRHAYPNKMSPARCSEEAQALMKHPLISPLIAEAVAETEKAQSLVVKKLIDDSLAQFQLTKAGVIARLGILASSDPRDFFDWDGKKVTLKPSSALTAEQAYAVQEVSQGKDGIKLKLADRRQALMDYARLMGWVVETGQVIGPDGKPVNPNQQTFILSIERGSRPAVDIDEDGAPQARHNRASPEEK